MNEDYPFPFLPFSVPSLTGGTSADCHRTSHGLSAECPRTFHGSFQCFQWVGPIWASPFLDTFPVAILLAFQVGRGRFGAQQRVVKPPVRAENEPVQGDRLDLVPAAQIASEISIPSQDAIVGREAAGWALRPKASHQSLRAAQPARGLVERKVVKLASRTAWCRTEA